MGAHFEGIIPSQNMLNLVFLTIVSSANPALTQEVNFGDSASPKISEAEVGGKLFNLNGGDILGTAIGTGLGNLGSGLISNCLGIGKRSAQDVSEGDVNTRLFGLCKPNCNTCSCFDNKCSQYCGKCNNNGGGGILCKRSAQDVSEADVSGKLFGITTCGNNVNCNTCRCWNQRCKNQCNKCQFANCNTCRCRSNKCITQCSKCNNFNNNGNFVNCNTCFCSSSSCNSQCNKCFNNNNNFVNCNTCFCSSNNCYDQCSKCYNNNNNNGFSANCNSCSCSYNDCRNQCYKCNNNYDGWRAGSSTQVRAGSSDSSDSSSGGGGGAVNFDA